MKKVVLQLEAPLSDDDSSHNDTDPASIAGQSDKDKLNEEMPEDKPADKPISIEYANLARMLVNSKVSICFGEVSPHSACIFVTLLISISNKNHFQLYKMCCEAVGITMHPWAIPFGDDQCLSRQLTLDKILVPKVPMFTKEGLLEYIMELIVMEDKALQLIDKPAFCSLLHYICPALTEGDIPHCTKITETIKDHAAAIIEVICECLAKVDSQVSMTFNLWTLIIGDPFFCVTGHYIWSPDNNLQQ
ncbi:hypothetical protein BDR04DRAFT_1119906 [Suillus decipiens]|nr:hypothetical protein BDR04DRAFT_1119906 [Suillus decipiens]